jgi:hypothetical protein
MYIVEIVEIFSKVSSRYFHARKILKKFRDKYYAWIRHAYNLQFLIAISGYSNSSTNLTNVKYMEKYVENKIATTKEQLNEWFLSDKNEKYNKNKRWKCNQICTVVS